MLLKTKLISTFLFQIQTPPVKKKHSYANNNRKNRDSASGNLHYSHFSSQKENGARIKLKSGVVHGPNVGETHPNILGEPAACGPYANLSLVCPIELQRQKR